MFQTSKNETIYKYTKKSWRAPQIFFIRFHELENFNIYISLVKFFTGFCVAVVVVVAEVSLIDVVVAAVLLVTLTEEVKIVPLASAIVTEVAFSNEFFLPHLLRLLKCLMLDLGLSTSPNLSIRVPNNLGYLAGGDEHRL